MEPFSVVLICAALGTVVLLTAFIRQILISRDKELNDNAQSRAMDQEFKQLLHMRTQMQNEKRFESHYQVLGTNKEAIQYLDVKIEEVLRKKAALIERYSQVIVKESSSIVNGEISVERKAICDRLRAEIDQEIAFYDSELKQIQERRESLWDAHTDFQRYLLNQEKSRNTNLDSVYKQHSALLEKVYIRHIDDVENVAIKGLETSAVTFKDMLMMPFQFLMQYFGGGTPGISLVHTRVENVARVRVEQAQHEINAPVLENNEEDSHIEKRLPKHNETPPNGPEVEAHKEEKESDKAKSYSFTFV